MELNGSYFPDLAIVAYSMEPLDDALHVGSRTKDHEPLIDYLDIYGVGIKDGFFSDTLYVKANKTYALGNLGAVTARKLYDNILRQIRATILKRLTEKGLFDTQTALLLDGTRYIARSDIEVWLNSLPDIRWSLVHHLFYQDFCFPRDLPDSVRQVCRVVLEHRHLLLGGKAAEDQGSPEINRCNDTYVKNEIQSFTPLFNRLEKYPLSDEQMRAAVVDEDRNLLIAAAGSGKSSTIVAKVVYLVHRGLAKPEETLVLAYNKDAQVEIDRRLAAQKGVVPEFDCFVTAKTFHGLGVDIIAQVEGKKPSTSELATAGWRRQLVLFGQLIQNLRQRDRIFAKKWQEFNLYGRYSWPDPFQFSKWREYENYLRDLGVILKSSPQGRRPALLTLDGHEVKSMEEVVICNWLAVHGVRYEYERRYPEETATKDFRQYYPDFYYPEIDTYHEHFALDANGMSPTCFGQDYLGGVKWKREFHKKKNNAFFETLSAEARDGSIFDRLESQLTARGVELKPLSSEEIDRLIAKWQDIDGAIELFVGVLQHFKANNAQMSWLRERARSVSEKLRANLFLSLFEPFYEEYNRRLGDEVDFQDQINRASDYLERGIFSHPYKYVLIDEAQDLSQDRKRIIRALLGQRPDIKLFAVGDDWQSIYRFSGADIDIMTNFQEHFGYTATNYLTRTFRSYQGLVDLAAAFVQKNPSQFKKTVEAHANHPGEQVIIDSYISKRDMQRVLEVRLAQINGVALKQGQRLSVFILARYNDLKPPGMGQYAKSYPHLDISFRSIHASKGLEADYVLLLGVANGRGGFPSRITDDPLLHLVIPRPEGFPDAEERRLMYVAITRAKRAIFILSDKARTSPFIQELSKMPGVKLGNGARRENPCPNCHGELKRRSSQGSAFLGCSNFPDCRYTRPV